MKVTLIDIIEVKLIMVLSHIEIVIEIFFILKEGCWPLFTALTDIQAGGAEDKS